MSIKNWPASERPREKLLQYGSAALTDAELLAIFLRTGCAGKSAVDLARELLSSFGNLRALLEASEQQFCKGLGLGQAKFTQLQAVIEMAKRHLAEGLDKTDLLNSSSAVKSYLLAHLRDKPNEVFSILLLDSQNQLLHFEVLFQGTIDCTAVYPREVLKKVLQYNASAVIFAHNHPSGSTNPSQADKDITAHLQQALALIDVRVLDHMIVGDNNVFSFAENQLLR